MMTKTQRKNYLIIVGIFMLCGMLIFGFIAVLYRVPLPNAFFYPLLGGVQLGGIPSGIILFGRFIKRKPVVWRILSCVFFPVTIVIIVACGIALVIPCYVSNALILVKTRNCDDQNHYEKVSADISKKVYRLYGIIAIVFIAANFAYSAALNMQIAGRIQESSGYAPGSPDYVVLKNYYYSEETEDYKNLDYDYTVVKSALFILAKKNSMCKSDIIFALPNGRFPEKNRYNKFASPRGIFMRKDIRKYFSEIKIANVGSQYAYMVIIDSRSDEQRAADRSETLDISMEDAYLSLNSTDDKNHINVDELQLANHKGVSPEKIQISGGEYVAYCDSFSIEDKDYSLTVSYRGEQTVLLTYDDIVRLKVLHND